MRRLTVSLAALFLPFPLLGQDQDQEQRVPVPALIDSWYKVIQDGEHRGYFHERISTIPKRFTKYEYLLEAEYDYTHKDDGGEESLIINEMATGELEEDFDVFTMDVQIVVNGAKLTQTIRTFPDLDRRSVEIVLPGADDTAERRELEMSSTEPFWPFVQPLFYKLRQGGDLAQPRTIRLKVKTEEETPAPVEVIVTAMADLPVLEKTFRVNPVTISGWDRRPLPPLTRFWVDKFGRVVEAATADDKLRVHLAKDDRDARGSGTRGVTAKGRRDPFSKTGALTPLKGPAATAKKEKEAPKPGKPLEIKDSEVDRYLKEAKAKIQTLQEEVARRDMAAAEKSYQDFLLAYEALYSKVQKNPVQRSELDDLKGQAERFYGGAEKLLARAETHLRAINDLYATDDVEAIDKEIKALQNLRGRREFFKDERILELDRIILQAEQKRAQAQARIELAKKVILLSGIVSETQTVMETVQIDVTIGGGRLSVKEPVKVVQQVTFAVINDQLYKEGDVVAGEGVRVDRISRHSVEISYKGEVRLVGMKK
ncbi:MAG: hypothetical protein HY716_14640 [Planctomycetes bacterium]|nr:hypothetical protein [Planctomycetota bacterium]